MEETLWNFFYMPISFRKSATMNFHPLKKATGNQPTIFHQKTWQLTDNDEKQSAESHDRLHQ